MINNNRLVWQKNFDTEGIRTFFFKNTIFMEKVNETYLRRYKLFLIIIKQC